MKGRRSRPKRKAIAIVLIGDWEWMGEIGLAVVIDSLAVDWVSDWVV